MFARNFWILINWSQNIVTRVPLSIKIFPSLNSYTNIILCIPIPIKPFSLIRKKKKNIYRREKFPVHIQNNANLLKLSLTIFHWILSSVPPPHLRPLAIRRHNSTLFKSSNREFRRVVIQCIYNVTDSDFSLYRKLYFATC